MSNLSLAPGQLLVVGGREPPRIDQDLTQNRLFVGCPGQGGKVSVDQIKDLGSSSIARQ